MARKSKVSFKLKIAAVEDYINGKKSMLEISDELSVDISSVKAWVRIYQSFGASGIIPRSKNATYSKELKISAVEDYLTGKGSLRDISLKYGLRSKSQLETWILKYTGHEEIKSYGVGGNRIMTEGRKTTLEERIKIVEYCIKNSKDYNETAKNFQVSYQQVRNWVLKYEELGVDGLSDRRGKQKPADEWTDFEKLKAEMKLLEAKNKRLEMENELLKKLKEIERRRC